MRILQRAGDADARGKEVRDLFYTYQNSLCFICASERTGIGEPNSKLFLIDTNVVSELMHSAPSVAVAAWIAEQSAGDLVLTSISEAELRYGVAIVPAGRRRNELEGDYKKRLAEIRTGFPFDKLYKYPWNSISLERFARRLPWVEAPINAWIKRSNLVVNSITPRFHNALQESIDCHQKTYKGNSYQTSAGA